MSSQRKRGSLDKFPNIKSNEKYQGSAASNVFVIAVQTIRNFLNSKVTKSDES